MDDNTLDGLQNETNFREIPTPYVTTYIPYKNAGVQTSAQLNHIDFLTG